jgi:hypothetical protein
MIKTFEEYDYVHDNSLVWVVGIPSGEALQIPHENLNPLYAEKLIWYDNKYTGVGFYAFNDDDISLVKRYISPPKKSKDLKVVPPKMKTTNGPDIMIYNHHFDDALIDTIVGIMHDYPTEIELYVQDECMGITYGDYYIEIDLEEGRSPRYRLVKRRNLSFSSIGMGTGSDILDKYGVSTDRQLIDRIETELYT